MKDRDFGDYNKEYILYLTQIENNIEENKIELIINY